MPVRRRRSLELAASLCRQLPANADGTVDVDMSLADLGRYGGYRGRRADGTGSRWLRELIRIGVAERIRDGRFRLHPDRLPAVVAPMPAAPPPLSITATDGGLMADVVEAINAHTAAVASLIERLDRVLCLLEPAHENARGTARGNARGTARDNARSGSGIWAGHGYENPEPEPEQTRDPARGKNARDARDARAVDVCAPLVDHCTATGSKPPGVDHIIRALSVHTTDVDMQRAVIDEFVRDATTSPVINPAGVLVARLTRPDMAPLAADLLDRARQRVTRQQPPPERDRPWLEPDVDPSYTWGPAAARGHVRRTAADL